MFCIHSKIKFLLNFFPFQLFNLKSPPVRRFNSSVPSPQLRSSFVLLCVQFTRHRRQSCCFAICLGLQPPPLSSTKSFFQCEILFLNFEDEKYFCILCVRASLTQIAVACFLLLGLLNFNDKFKVNS